MVSRIDNRLTAARRSERGFTLIELLVVIIILGILAAVVVFAVGGIDDRGEEAALATDERTLQTAEEAYFAQNGFYASEQTLEDQDYLNEQSTLNNIALMGDEGNPATTYRITCDINLSAGCGGANTLVTGGTLRVAGALDVTAGNFINPASTTSGGAHPNTEYAFNGLLRWAENDTAQPDLAQSYVISPDQMTATFTLRDVKFHDGIPLEAHDVDFTFRNAIMRYHGRTQGSMGPAFNASGTGSATTIPAGAITFPDPDGAGPLVGGPNGRGVQFNFVTPYAPLLRQMNVTEAPIIPEHIYGACPATGTGNISSTACALNNPGAGDLIAANAARHIGTGPFMLKERNTSTNTLTYVAYPDYHFENLPLAAELLQLPKSPADAANALQAGSAVAGAVDVATVPGDRLPPLAGPTIITGPDFATAAVPRGSGGGNCILTWGWNLWQNGKTPADIQTDIAANPTKRGDHPIFGDPTLVDPDGAGPVAAMARGLVVRKALTMAIDRTALFNNIEFGKGRVADSAYHSKLAPYQAQPAMPTFDLATADAWLDAAGWSDSFTPRQSTGATGMPPLGTPFTFTSHGFSTGTQATYFTQIDTQLNAGVKVDITTIATSTGPGTSGAFGTRSYDAMFFSVCHGDDPVIGARRTIHSQQISSTGFTNMSGYYNPTVDSLWNNAFGANYTPNHSQIQQIVVNEAPMLWISETQNTRAWRSNCGGFNNANTGLFVEGASCS